MEQSRDSLDGVANSEKSMYFAITYELLLFRICNY